MDIRWPIAGEGYRTMASSMTLFFFLRERERAAVYAQFTCMETIRKTIYEDR